MEVVGICVDNRTGDCCLIKSNATFEMLKSDFDLYKIEFDATNWGGCDKIERTLELRNLALTGESFKHSGVATGEDSDCGHSYGWRFEFDEIREVKSRTPELELYSLYYDSRTDKFFLPVSKDDTRYYGRSGKECERTFNDLNSYDPSKVWFTRNLFISVDWIYNPEFDLTDRMNKAFKLDEDEIEFFKKRLEEYENSVSKEV